MTTIATRNSPRPANLWAGPISALWPVVQLRHIARLYAGGTPDRKTERYWTQGTIPWLNSGAVNQRLITEPSDYITEEAWQASSAKWIPKGALVIALAGQGKTKGMVAQLAIDSTCNQSMAAIVPDSRIASRFLLRWLEVNYDTIRNLAGGELRDGLNLDIVGEIPCPVPSPQRQHSIANYLDSETARIDALIEKKRRLEEHLEAEFRAAQVAILTGVEHEARECHPILGSLPRHWSARRAKYCTERITVGVVVNPSAYFVDEGMPFVHGTDVREGYIDTSDLKMLSAESNKLLAKSQLRRDDVVAMRVGYPGRAAVVPPQLDGANCASVLVFRHSDVLRPELLCEFLNSPLGRAQIEAVQYGAAQEVMNVSDAVDLCLPVPPPSEQAAVAARIRSARARWRDGCHLLGRQIALLREHRQALITAVVTGELHIAEAA